MGSRIQLCILTGSRQERRRFVVVGVRVVVDALGRVGWMVVLTGAAQIAPVHVLGCPPASAEELYEQHLQLLSEYPPCYQVDVEVEGVVGLAYFLYDGSYVREGVMPLPGKVIHLLLIAHVLVSFAESRIKDVKDGDWQNSEDQVRWYNQQGQRSGRGPTAPTTSASGASSVQAWVLSKSLLCGVGVLGICVVVLEGECFFCFGQSPGLA